LKHRFEVFALVAAEKHIVVGQLWILAIQAEVKISPEQAGSSVFSSEAINA